jgi:hypothetical protein
MLRLESNDTLLNIEFVLTFKVLLLVMACKILADPDTFKFPDIDIFSNNVFPETNKFVPIILLFKKCVFPVIDRFELIVVEL